METVARKFVGIDLHEQVIQVCVLDSETRDREERRFRIPSLAEGEEVVAWLAKKKAEARYVVEAVGMNRWFVDRCLAAGMDIVVADPRRLDLKMLGKKTDREDARELARRLMLGDIDANALSYYPTAEEYEARKVLRTRRKLTQIRQSVGSQIRGMLRAFKVTAPGGRLYSAAGLRWLAECEVGGEDVTRCVRGMGRVLAAVQAEVAVLESRIREWGEQRRVAAFAAVAQIGEITAGTLAFELGDLSRFHRTRAIAAAAGLAPRVNNSADRAHHGPITHRGNRHLRWIMGQMAVRLLANDRRVKVWAEQRMRRMHYNKVRTALARRLLVGICAAMRRGEAFSLERCLGV